MIGQGRSVDWAIQGPSGARKKVLYINVCNTKAKTNLIYFSTILEIYKFIIHQIQRAKTLAQNAIKK